MYSSAIIYHNPSLMCSTVLHIFPRNAEIRMLRYGNHSRGFFEREHASLQDHRVYLAA
jgi:hypothetical protein